MIKKSTADICSRLHKRIVDGPLELEVHSAFDHALNFTSDLGMVTILPRGKALQPYSIRLVAVLEFDREWQELENVVLTTESLGDVKLTNLRPTNLQSIPLPTTPTWVAEGIRDLLCERIGDGIVGLIDPGYRSKEVDFIRPRIEKFREAVSGGDLEQIRAATQEIAGFGPGLTPSTDDFICGYVAFAKGTDGKAITEAAARKTNDISAALLKRAGQGLFSQDIIGLMKAASEDAQISGREYIRKIAEWGSSSGCDFLTGALTAIQDVGGRRNEEV